MRQKVPNSGKEFRVMSTAQMKTVACQGKMLQNEAATAAAVGQAGAACLFLGMLSNPSVDMM